MARRRSSNRRWSRRSANATGILDQDSNIIDEEDQTVFWKHIGEETNILSASNRFSLAESISAELNPDSRIVDDIESEEWWGVLQTTNQDLIPKRAIKRKSMTTARNNLDIESSASESEDQTREVKKKRGRLRKSRRSTGEDIFSQALDTSEPAVESEPGPSSKRKSSQISFRSLEDYPLKSSRRQSRSNVHSPESNTSTDTEKVKKARPTLFKKPSLRKSINVFDDILEGDDSVVSPSQDTPKSRTTIKPRSTFFRRPNKPLTPDNKPQNQSKQSTGDQSLNLNKKSTHNPTLPSSSANTENIERPTLEEDEESDEIISHPRIHFKRRQEGNTENPFDDILNETEEDTQEDKEGEPSQKTSAQISSQRDNSSNLVLHVTEEDEGTNQSITQKDSSVNTSKNPKNQSSSRQSRVPASDISSTSSISEELKIRRSQPIPSESHQSSIKDVSDREKTTHSTPNFSISEKILKDWNSDDSHPSKHEKSKQNNANHSRTSKKSSSTLYKDDERETKRGSQRQNDGDVEEKLNTRTLSKNSLPSASQEASITAPPESRKSVNTQNKSTKHRKRLEHLSSEDSAESDDEELDVSPEKLPTKQGKRETTSNLRFSSRSNINPAEKTAEDSEGSELENEEIFDTTSKKSLTVPSRSLKQRKRSTPLPLEELDENNDEEEQTSHEKSRQSNRRTTTSNSNLTKGRSSSRHSVQGTEKTADSDENESETEDIIDTRSRKSVNVQNKSLENRKPSKEESKRISAEESEESDTNDDDILKEMSVPRTTRSSSRNSVKPAEKAGQVNEESESQPDETEDPPTFKQSDTDRNASDHSSSQETEIIKPIKRISSKETREKSQPASDRDVAEKSKSRASSKSIQPSGPSRDSSGTSPASKKSGNVHNTSQQQRKRSRQLPVEESEESNNEEQESPPKKKSPATKNTTTTTTSKSATFSSRHSVRPSDKIAQDSEESDSEAERMADPSAYELPDMERTDSIHLSNTEEDNEQPSEQTNLSLNHKTPKKGKETLEVSRKTLPRVSKATPSTSGIQKETPKPPRKSGTISHSANQRDILSYFTVKAPVLRERPHMEIPVVDPNSDLCKKLRELKKQREQEKKIELGAMRDVKPQTATKPTYAMNTKNLGKKKSTKDPNDPTKGVDKAFIVNGKVYKQPRLPRPKHWATNRLYEFLWKKMTPKYGLETRIRSERFVTDLAVVVGLITRRKKYDNYKDELDALMKKMAHLEIVVTPDDFYHFCRDFLPYEFRVKVTPILHPGNVHLVPFNPDKVHQPILQQ